jgi:hypothetical protein
MPVKYVPTFRRNLWHSDLRYLENGSCRRFWGTRCPFFTAQEQLNLSKKKEVLTLLRLTFIYFELHTKTQFLPHREYTPWPLQRPIASCCIGKSTFIVRILWSAYRYCMCKMQSFVTLQQVVRIITIRLYKVKEVESVSGKSESVSHSILV